MNKPLILIADDDERLLVALTIRLEALGFEVVKATNGSQALELAIQRPPELLILDVNMPTCDGFSLVEKMDKVAGLQDIPVIYITGADTQDDVGTTSERLGAIAIIQKPFELEDLIENVSLVIPLPSGSG